MHTSYLSLAVFAIGATAAPSFPKPNGDPFAGSFPFFPSGSSSQSDEDSGLSNPVPAYMAAMQAVQSAQQGAYGTPQPTQAAVPHHHRPAAPAPVPVPAPAPVHEEPEPFHPKVQHKPMEKPQPALPAPMDDPVDSNPVPPDSIPAIPSEPAAPAPEPTSHKPHPAVPSSAIAAEISQAMPSDDGINNVAEEIPTATQAPMTVTPIHAMQTPMASPSQPLIHATPTHAMMSSFVSMASPSPTHRPMHSMGIHEGHMSSSKASATPSSSATPTPTPIHAPATKPGLLGLAPIVNSVPILGPLLSPLVGG